MKTKRVRHLQRVVLTNTTVELYPFHWNRRRIIRGRGTRQRPRPKNDAHDVRFAVGFSAETLTATELVLTIENHVAAISVEYCNQRLNTCHFDRDGRFGGFNLEPIRK